MAQAAAAANKAFDAEFIDFSILDTALSDRRAAPEVPVSRRRRPRYNSGMRLHLPLLVLLAATAALPACGQKGPLVLPDAQHTHKKVKFPSPKPASAPAAPASTPAGPAPEASPQQPPPGPAAPHSNSTPDPVPQG